MRLVNARLVLPDRVTGPATLVVTGDRLAEIDEGAAADRPADAGQVDVAGRLVVPGFIDVHVHGVEGRDTLDAAAPIAEIAARLPRYGVTAFCPTTVACAPEDLRRVLDAVGRARHSPAPHASRVLPAHLESNFISPEYKGAQPLDCLRRPPGAERATRGEEAPPLRDAPGTPANGWSGADIRAVVAAAASEVGIVTLAPELPDALDLIRDLVASGHRVSLGHSGADYDQAMAGIEAGARHATHLFNRMPPLHHRAPGLAGAVLADERVTVEIICDAYHVHPALVRAAIGAKGPGGIVAITDGTAGSGLPVGARASLGGRPIAVRETAAFLDDGTLAGSSLTMDRAFRMLVEACGASLVEAAAMTSLTPARALGRPDQGRLEPGALADFVVLDDALRVQETWIGGVRAFPRGADASRQAR